MRDSRRLVLWIFVRVSGIGREHVFVVLARCLRGPLPRRSRAPLARLEAPTRPHRASDVLRLSLSSLLREDTLKNYALRQRIADNENGALQNSGAFYYSRRTVPNDEEKKFSRRTSRALFSFIQRRYGRSSKRFRIKDVCRRFAAPRRPRTCRRPLIPASARPSLSPAAIYSHPRRTFAMIPLPLRDDSLGRSAWSY